MMNERLSGATRRISLTVGLEVRSFISAHELIAAVQDPASFEDFELHLHTLFEALVREDLQDLVDGGAASFQDLIALGRYLGLEGDMIDWVEEMALAEELKEEVAGLSGVSGAQNVTPMAPKRDGDYIKQRVINSTREHEGGAFTSTVVRALEGEHISEVEIFRAVRLLLQNGELHMGRNMNLELADGAAEHAEDRLSQVGGLLP